MDAALLGPLMDAHAAGLTLYARQWCVAPEDVVQEAFMKLVAQAETPMPIEPWLYRVVRNLAISAARAENRRRRHEGRLSEQQPAWFVPRDETILDANHVTESLQRLPSAEREVIVMHLWGGLSFAQIAEVLGGSSSGAHRRYVAGLQQLRERLMSCQNPSIPNFMSSSRRSGSSGPLP
jgi:RNA polymerase sigma factor (sigma-70 family)